MNRLRVVIDWLKGLRFTGLKPDFVHLVLRGKSIKTGRVESAHASLADAQATLDGYLPSKRKERIIVAVPLNG